MEVPKTGQELRSMDPFNVSTENSRAISDPRPLLGPLKTYFWGIMTNQSKGSQPYQQVNQAVAF